MDHSFFEMVKYWTVRDYKTPGTKAEVILDMLISGFVEELIRYHFSERNEKVNVTLLAKEFPIRTLNKDKEELIKENNRNAKVDFLVYIDKKELLLVELKTSKDSFDKKQKTIMKKAIDGGTSDLIELYDNICGSKNGNSEDHEKYDFSKSIFEEKLKEAQVDREYIKTNCKLDYLYILLTDDNRIPKEKKLILTDYCKNKKFREKINEKDLWDKISEILLECADSLKQKSPKEPVLN